MGLRSNRYRTRDNRGKRSNRHRAWTGRDIGILSFGRRGIPQHGRDQAGPENEIEALKTRARAIEARLWYLSVRIGKIEQGYTAPSFIAIVDAENCAGCGICQDTCPTGAVLLKEVARIDPERCNGCGRCIERCPQGALSLRPVKSSFQEQTESAL